MTSWSWWTGGADGPEPVSARKASSATAKVTAHRSATRGRETGLESVMVRRPPPGPRCADTAGRGSGSGFALRLGRGRVVDGLGALERRVLAGGGRREV